MGTIRRLVLPRDDIALNAKALFIALVAERDQSGRVHLLARSGQGVAWADLLEWLSKRGYVALERNFPEGPPVSVRVLRARWTEGGTETSPLSLAPATYGFAFIDFLNLFSSELSRRKSDDPRPSHGSVSWEGFSRLLERVDPNIEWRMRRVYLRPSRTEGPLYARSLEEAREAGFSVREIPFELKDADGAMMVDMLDVEFGRFLPGDNVVYVVGSGDRDFIPALARAHERAASHGVYLSVEIFSWRGNYPQRLPRHPYPIRVHLLDPHLASITKP